jgi:acetylornithine deacetylase/succinyl-diaminopimelate desuccinylase-like protein
VRTLPDEDPSEVTDSIRQAIDDVGVGAEIQLLLSKPGKIGQGIEPLTDAVAAAHRRVRGVPPPDEAEAAVVSMWRDNNLYNAAGIPSLTFGPGRGKADVQGTGHFELDDLVDASKMYALIALQVAAGIPPEALG